MHTIISPVFYVYALIVLLGGAFGYVKAKSVPSLISGIVAAVLEAAAGFLAPRHPRSGVGLGTLVALALVVVFFQRYRATGNPMPAAPMSVLSGLVFALGAVDLITTHAF